MNPVEIQQAASIAAEQIGIKTVNWDKYGLGDLIGALIKATHEEPVEIGDASEMWRELSGMNPVRLKFTVMAYDVMVDSPTRILQDDGTVAQITFQLYLAIPMSGSIVFRTVSVAVYVAPTAERTNIMVKTT